MMEISSIVHTGYVDFIHLALVLACCGLTWVVLYLGSSTPTKSDPLSDALLKGYRDVIKVSGKPFRVRSWKRDYVILPLKYLPDIRRAARDHLVLTISDVFFLYTWVGDLFDSTRMVYAIIKGINPQLPKLSDCLIQETEFAFEAEIGLKSGELKSLNALAVMTGISLRSTARVIAGKELARHEAFLAGAHNYFAGSFSIGVMMLWLPFGERFRHLVAWPLYKYHAHFRHRPLVEIIKPFATKQMEMHKRGNPGDAEFNTIQVMFSLMGHSELENSTPEELRDRLAQETLHLSWAGGQSPAISAAGILFKLLEMPEYITPLREEAQAAIRKHGWTDPIFNELSKLDSFIRETHRLSPTFSLSVMRIVKNRPFVFSDGFEIPVGTRIGFAAEGCQQDTDLIGDPEMFDGFRFVRMVDAKSRQEDGVNRWAASHTSHSNLTFGYGNHACPGRFITIRLLKLILTRVLLEYDISWNRPDGEKAQKYSFEGIGIPNPTQEITFRRR
ncbi:cytochrome P450 [Xylariaceae sp. AK1471]|nr:cytochrome P450 [Xylariaceae sp. AK1471]